MSANLRRSRFAIGLASIAFAVTLSPPAWAEPAPAYTELLEESRQEAMNRMIEKARSMGANAIVGIRFSTSNIAQGASELFVYGTAVVVDPIMPKLPDPFPQAD